MTSCSVVGCLERKKERERKKRTKKNKGKREKKQDRKEKNLKKCQKMSTRERYLSPAVINAHIYNISYISSLPWGW